MGGLRFCEVMYIEEVRFDYGRCAFCGLENHVEFWYAAAWCEVTHLKQLIVQFDVGHDMVV